MKIKLSTEGELSTVPEIKDGKLLKLIGMNGVGKSMAAIFLEIATGNYRFENKAQFNEIKNRFKECKIKIETRKDFFEIWLTPGTWRFNENDFKLEGKSIGFFKHNNKDIDFNELQNFLLVKVIRGDENFETQLTLVSNMFLDILETHLSNLDNQISIFKEYSSKFEDKIDFNKVLAYKKLQNSYSDVTEEKLETENKLQNAEKEKNSTEEKIGLIKKINLWKNNNPEVIKNDIEEVKNHIHQYQTESEELTLKLNDIEKKIENIEKKKQKQIKSYIEERNKQERDKNRLITKITEHFPEEVNDIMKSDNIDSIKILQEKKIQTLEYAKNSYDEFLKGKIEVKNKLLEKSRLIKDILDECMAEGLENEILIEDYYEDIFLELKVEEINKYIKNRISILEKSPEHTAQKEKLKELKKDFDEINKLLEFIKKWEKLIKKDNELRQQRQNISKDNLDQFLEPEIIKKSLDSQDKLLNDRQQVNIKLVHLNSKLNEFKKRESLTNGLKPLVTLETQYRDLYGEIPNNLDSTIENIEVEISDKIKNLNGLEFNLNKLVNKQETIKEQIDKIKLKIMDKAKVFKFSEFVRWIEYVEKHDKKIKYLINEILNPFYDYIRNLKDLFIKIEKNKNVEKEPFLQLVSEIYNQFFLDTYKNQSFFKYVFKDYNEIKSFDIAERKIIFVKKSGEEDHRSLSDFSSGEKAYAFIRAMITLFNEKSHYKILFIDEANALMDYLRSGDLLDFQIELLEKGYFDKIINILPIKEPPDENSEFYNEYQKNGYYQEPIHMQKT